MKLKKFSNILFCLIFLLLSAGNLSAQTTREALEKKRIELRNEITRINELRSSNKQKERSVLSQVEDLDQQIRSTENLIKVTNQQANLLTNQISANTNKISRLRQELEQLKEDYARMIEKSYKSKSTQSRIMFLLSSENFLQAYKRLQYMKQYTNYRKQQGDEIQARTEELQQLNADLADQKETKDALIAENRQTRAQLEKNKKAQQDLMQNIRSKEGEFAAQIRQKQQEINRIDAQIEKMIRESIAKSNEESGSAERDVYELTPEAKALAADFVKNKGRLPWPVRSGVVTSRFGKQPHPVVKTISINNNGVNIDTDPGGKARAVFNGTVSEVQVLKGANKAVMVRHGDYITIYDNLEKVFVKRGDVVNTGQELGAVATSRTSGKTTLHFLIYKNMQKMDPADWILEM
ncbi:MULTISPECIES: peptidoglycan DD-metalloendopeptidase family protein [Salegentibacter]|jgi:septal ring factor EnvC (AmiA/AmiB activator)|uniref:Septal ring factor EnvC, activator of murein hydrolases AmiA and AmiB n=1 Tax=Salegentibacter agarivorans TaxID=345907 RepID=A0A1I2M2T2_9FLAO|nr:MULTISPECIES: peptidoglycan DD-metalloendopeptidase family protein [Salegentibacter]APS38230.1 peptidase M23 [Salegentibacter sp. T436]SFF85029.1 Septal ring factor EnvC, activator of murein hydrolases AmiA and AmiB [Salegentibacter agarivorans]|tara:strand:- start:198 stop:1421 length:1224 start_codon:yes stop_codon:yes gene_type:complete